jgi:hypothetical protein
MLLLLPLLLLLLHSSNSTGKVLWVCEAVLGLITVA